MKHASTRKLFEYWNRQRGNRSAPARSDIDPGDISQALGDTFMLSADFTGETRFRLAGTRVCALFGRELKGESFCSLWNEESSAPIGDIVTAAMNESIGTVAGIAGRTKTNEVVELEMLLLPIALDGQTRLRAFGGLAAQVLPYWLYAEPLVELEVRSLRHIGVDQSRSGRIGARLLKGSSRARHGFLVYDGGRSSRPRDAG